MSESGPPGGPPSTPPSGGRTGGKRPAIGLQLKLPCATPDEVRTRYGADLKQSRFFIRTKQPRPVDTLVRLDALLSTGSEHGNFHPSLMGRLPAWLVRRLSERKL